MSDITADYQGTPAITREAHDLAIADLERQLAEAQDAMEKALVVELGLRAELAKVQGKLEHCGQENCMGYRLSDAANWVREERLIEAQKKLDAVWKVRTVMQKHRTVPTTRTVQRVLDPYISALARILKEENDVN